MDNLCNVGSNPSVSASALPPQKNTQVHRREMQG